LTQYFRRFKSISIEII